MPTPTLPPPPVSLPDAQAAARAHAQAMQSEYDLARGKGESPQQIEARKAVARQFCEIHLPADALDQRDGRLGAIDYTCPVIITNARGVDVNNSKSAGFLGMGRKKAYIVSAAYPPKKPDDPIYALEYTLTKR